MNLLELWALIGPVVSAVGAAILVHFLTRRRDQANYQMRLEEEAKIAARRVRREHLLNAYRALDASEPQRLEFKKVGHEEHLQLVRERAAALADVNLFGDESLAEQLDKIIRQGPNYDTSQLMNLLRDKLREEFGLEPTSARYKWVEVRLDPAGHSDNDKGGESAE